MKHVEMYVLNIWKLNGNNYMYYILLSMILGMKYDFELLHVAFIVHIA